MYGLSQEELLFLEKNCLMPLKASGAEVYLFGSRAIGNYKKFSDIDLAYKESLNQGVPAQIITNILILFEDSRFPYKLDLVKYESIAASYLPEIDRTKVRI